MGIHYAGYSPEARINALRWRPPLTAFAELFSRRSIRLRIRRRHRSAMPSPITDLSTAFVTQMVSLREVLTVSPPRIEDMQNPEAYQRLVDSLNRDHHEPDYAPPTDPRLSAERSTQDPPSIYAYVPTFAPRPINTVRLEAGDNMFNEADAPMPPLIDVAQYGGQQTWPLDQSQYLADQAIRTLEHLGHPVYVPSMNILAPPQQDLNNQDVFNNYNPNPLDEYDPFDVIPYDSDSDTEPDYRR